MKKVFVLFLMFLGLSSSHAQKIEVDNQSFPTIKIKIRSEKSLTEKNIKITQDSKDIAFSLIENSDSTATKGNGKAIYFLVETSGFTNTQVVNNFKSGINGYIKSAPEGTLFNAASFWKADSESKILNNLNADFTNSKDALIGEINQKIRAVRDTIQQADIHKAIYDALDYVSKTSNNAEKVIVVLTAGVNKSYSNFKIEDCIDKANSHKIKVYSLVYKTGFPYALDNLKKLADKTNAQSELVNSSAEITDKISSFVSSEPQKPATDSYELSFTLPSPENTANLQISIDDKAQAITVSKPESTKSGSNNLPLYIGVGFVLMAALVYAFIQRSQKQKKKQEAEQNTLKNQLEQQKQQFLQDQQSLQQQLQNQQFSQQPTVVKEEPKKFDPKKTFIGVGGGTPTISVVGQGINKTFELHKPTMTVGRKEDNDIVIPVQTVSGNHATFSNEGGNWYVTDNGSTNGVIVNGNKIDKHILKQGDKVQLGGALITINL